MIFGKSLIPAKLSAQTTSIAKWSVTALVLRIIITPLLGSRDLSATTWVSLSLLSNHQLVQSNDPPLILLMFAGLFALFGPLIPSQITSFYLSPSTFNPSELKWVLALSQQGVQQLLIVFKFPYFIFDFATGLLLLRVVEDSRRAFLAYKLWLFNPASIFISYVVGQYDVIIAFLLVLALLQLQKNKLQYSALALGFAGAVKLIGLLLLVPLAIYRSRNESSHEPVASFLKTLAVGAIPVLLGLLPLLLIPPFYESANLALPTVSQNGFYGATLLNRGLAGASLISGLVTFVFAYSLAFHTGGSFETFFLQPIMYLGLLLALIHFRKFSIRGFRDVLLIFLLVYFALDTFHPQWFLWVEPLLVIALVESYDRLVRAYWLISALFFSYAANYGPYLTIGLLIPMFPNALAPANSMSQPGGVFDIVAVSLRMIFSVTLLYTGLLIFLERWGASLPWKQQIGAAPRK